MKLTLSLLAAVTTLGFAIPSTASADHCETRRVVSYLPCGRPVFAHYEVCGYDRLGRAVGHWETERASCDCLVCHPRPVVYSRPSCAPAPYAHRHSHGGARVEIRPGAGFSFSFGR